MKKIIKILLIILLVLVLVIFYLSIFGIKTDKFNNQINNNILKINKRVNLDLKDVSYLLNPYNFTINIKTTNPQILLEDRNLYIEDIQTNVALKSLINGQFSIDDLKITTKEIEIKDIIALLKVFQNSTKLFALNTIIKDGFVTADINLKFDKKGNIKKDYKIIGSIKKVKLKILNKVKLQNFNFDFIIYKNIYSLKRIDMVINNVKITSPSIEIENKKNSFFVNGQFFNDKKNFDIDELKPVFTNVFNTIDLACLVTFSKSLNAPVDILLKITFSAALPPSAAHISSNICSGLTI